jgi:hypothetical protein
MKALKHNGLVQVTVKKSFRAYREGETVRLSPSEAQLYVGSGYVEEAKLPKGVEALSVPDAESAMVSDKILPNPLPAIPDGWEGEHQLARMKLAEQLTGRPVKAAEADGIIKRELERRLTE